MTKRATKPKPVPQAVIEPVKPSLAICTPSGREPRWPYTFCVARLMGGLRSFSRVTLQIELGYATDSARCRLVKLVKADNYTHTLFIDDDMSFPADAAERLLSRDKDIVAANYTCRVFPVMPLASIDGSRIFSKGKTGLEEVHAAPTGMMLIKNTVFDKLEMPWFQTTFRPEHPDDWMSDDVWFCARARDAGFKVWIDHDLSNEIAHVGGMEFHHGMTQPPEEQQAARSVAKMAQAFVGSPV